MTWKASRRVREETEARWLSWVRISIHCDPSIRLVLGIYSPTIVVCPNYSMLTVSVRTSTSPACAEVSVRPTVSRPSSSQKQKAVVTPQWLRDSVEHGAPLPCEDYAALQDLRAETAAHCPDCNLAPCACSDVSSPSLSPGPTMGSRPPTPGGSQTIGQEPPPTSPTSASAIAPKARSRSKPTSKPASKPAPGPSTRPAAEVPVHLLPPSPPIPTNAAKLDFRSRYTCQRASPLECPNSGLVGELDIMRRARAMEGEERSALSYARAVAAIKGECAGRLVSALCGRTLVETANSVSRQD